MKNLQSILLLFVANAISGVAQGISMIAIPWYFAKENFGSRFALIYAIITAISFFWGPICGTFVDKYNRKHIFLSLCAVCFFILSSVAAYGFYTGSLPWYLIAFVFLMTFMNYNLHYPNLYAFVQEITEQKYYGKITSYIEVHGQITTVLAGAGAAMLLEGTENGMLVFFGFNIPLGFDILPWKMHEIFFLDACTYVLAFTVISFIRFTPLIKRVTETGSIIQRFQTGFEYLKKNKNILLFGIVSYSIFVCVLITPFYLSSNYVEHHLNEGGGVFASSEMYYALGAIFAGIMIRKIFKNISIVSSIIIMTVLSMGLYFVMAVQASVAVFYGMNLLLGITNAGTRIQRINYLFKVVPNQFYGRVGSIFFLSNILFRVSFLLLFALPFFQEGHVVYSMGVLSLFLALSSFILITTYTSLMAPIKIAENK